MNDKNEYVFHIDLERLKFYKNLTPEERFLWLEEAHEFVKNAVSVEQFIKWREYIKGKIIAR